MSDLINKYTDVFSCGDHDLGHTFVTTHVIDTGNGLPVASRPYWSGPAEREEIQRQISDMVL